MLGPSLAIPMMLVLSLACTLSDLTITLCNFHPFTFYLPFHKLFWRTDPYYTVIFYFYCGLQRPAQIFLSYFVFSRQASHDYSFRCHGDATITSHVASLWKWSGFYLLMKREHVDGIHKISRVFMFVWMLNLRSTNWVKASYCYYATPF